mgnify:CR=1 FL=1
MSQPTVNEYLSDVYGGVEIRLDDFEFRLGEYRITMELLEPFPEKFTQYDTRFVMRAHGGQ